MLIKIEKANSNIGCYVILDSWRIRLRSYGEAIAFVERLTERVNAPHALPEILGSNTALPIS